MSVLQVARVGGSLRLSFMFEMDDGVGCPCD